MAALADGGQGEEPLGRFWLLKGAWRLTRRCTENPASRANFTRGKVPTSGPAWWSIKKSPTIGIQMVATRRRPTAGILVAEDVRG